MSGFQTASRFGARGDEMGEQGGVGLCVGSQALLVGWALTVARGGGDLHRQQTGDEANVGPGCLTSLGHLHPARGYPTIERQRPRRHLNFAIAGAGVHTIVLTSAMPGITTG